MRAVTAVAGAFVVAVGVVACSSSTGNGNNGGGPTTILNETFSSGSLSNWIGVFGTPAIDATIGDPAPSAFLSNADMKTTATTTMGGGLTFKADIRVDSGVASFRLVQPGLPIALVRVFPDSAQYAICISANCSSIIVQFTADTDWHEYKFVYDASTSSGQWLRDGASQYTLANLPAQTGVFLKVGMFSKDSAGPSGGHYDNVVLTTP